MRKYILTPELQAALRIFEETNQTILQYLGNQDRIDKEGRGVPSNHWLLQAEDEAGARVALILLKQIGSQYFRDTPNGQELIHCPEEGDRQ
jgi:hypothetical protein